MIRSYLHALISFLKTANEIPSPATALRAFHFGAVLTSNLNISLSIAPRVCVSLNQPYPSRSYKTFPDPYPLGNLEARANEETLAFRLYCSCGKTARR